MNDCAVRTAVFPVAGLGSRFLPATKATPKEMMPIVDKPLIQYAAEEAIEAGVTHLVFVTGRNKRAIEDHFDTAAELEAELAEKNKMKLLDEIRNLLPQGISCSYVRQPRALGLGHAVLCARPVVGNHPFAVILPDDLIAAEEGCLKQMLAMLSDGDSAIAVETVPDNAVSSYGIVSVTDNAVNPARVEHLVEKPAAEDAPSNMAVIGRYVLQPEIFGILAHTGEGSGGEIQLTDAIEQLAQSKPVYACRFEGTRYDCGSKLGFLQATVQYGLVHPELGKDFREYLKGLS